MTIPAPLPTYDMTLSNSFNAAQWNFPNMLSILLQMYGAPFGAYGQTLVIGTTILSILGIIWLRQDDVAVPAFLLIFIGNAMYWDQMIPIQWQWLVVILFILLPFVGIIYSIWHKR